MLSITIFVTNMLRVTYLGTVKTSKVRIPNFTQSLIL